MAAIALALLAAGALFLAWRLLRAVPVEVVTAEPGSVLAHVSGPGTVQARVPVTISARLTSTIVEVAVDVGDVVVTGQPLVHLEGRDLEARHAAALSQQESIARQVDAAAAAVAKALADLELAQARRARDLELHERGFVSRASLDLSVAGARAAEAALQSAEATRAARRADQAALAHELVLARTQVGYTRLSAPMSAVVIQRLAEPGTTVAPGTPILRLVDPRSLWVATRIDEALVERIAVGQAALIRLRSGSTVRGRVERIAMQSDAATRQLDVNVAFSAVPPRVAIDQEAEVQIEVGREAGIVVPVGALTQDGAGRPGVLQVIDGRTRFLPVRLGPESEGVVLVRTGLRAGDVVVADAAKAKPGIRVRPAS
jgi:RND family efflux transporter MFP subunit